MPNCPHCGLPVGGDDESRLTPREERQIKKFGEQVKEAFRDACGDDLDQEFDETEDEES
jgi:hypothetical protein